MSWPVTVWLLARLVLALALAVVAAHVLVIFDSLLSWKITLLATEYGHRLAVLALVVLLIGVWLPGFVSRATSLLLFFSAVILLIPLLQARALAKTLPDGLAAAFPSKAPAAQPSAKVDFDGLWLGRRASQVDPEIMVYAGVGTEARRIFFYRGTVAHAPCLLLLHSGGWQNGRPDEFPQWSAWWASQGYAVASIEYRLAPRFIWPAQREDVTLAWAWLRQHAETLGIRPDCGILVGRSAGAQIALACAYGLHDATLRGVISFYGPADMLFARKYADPHDVLDSLKLIRDYMGGDPQGRMESYESASGFLLANRQSCPTLLIHGARDILVWTRQSQRLSGRLRELGVPSYYLQIPYGVHALDWPYSGPSSALVRTATLTFLHHLCPP